MANTRSKPFLISMAKTNGTVADIAMRKWGVEADLASGRSHPSLVCRALLRGMLEYTTTVPAHAWRLEATLSGQPTAVEDGGLAPSISMSHSGGWVACALSLRGKIGIDIEIMLPKRDVEGIAAMAFGPLENVRAEAEGISGFYRLWTLKEAISKAAGLGLAMAADGKDRIPGGPDEGLWKSSIEDRDWVLLHERPYSFLSLAVALDGFGDDLPDVEWWRPPSCW